MLPSLADLETALDQVLLDGYGVQASNGQRFKGAVFGRDSAIVGLDLYPWYPALAQTIILSLARLQGVGSNPLTEEEPGRIHHEHRQFVINGQEVSQAEADIIHKLQRRWRVGDDQGFTYYGSVDATPRFISLICAYCERYGRNLLREYYKDKVGRDRLVLDSLLAAANWLLSRLEASELGLLGFLRTNPRGMRWQALRDGATAYLHDNGRLANYTRPVESLDVQGVALEALSGLIALLPDHPDCQRWKAAANRLRQSVFDNFWLPGQRYWAMALDRDKQGQLRQLRSFTSVPAELLDTPMFDDLPADCREMYIASIVMHLFSPEFLTPVGIRMRSLRHSGLLNYWDYQGPFSCWVVTANIFARGLRRQGLVHLARDIEARYCASLDKGQAKVEFFYVDERRRVCYEPETGDGPGSIPATDVPENSQAWTISAAIRALQQWDDEGEIQSAPNQLEQASLYLGQLNRLAAEPNARFRINKQLGQAEEDRFIERNRYPTPA